MKLFTLFALMIAAQYSMANGSQNCQMVSSTFSNVQEIACPQVTAVCAENGSGNLKLMNRASDITEMSFLGKGRRNYSDVAQVILSTYKGENGEIAELEHNSDRSYPGAIEEAGFTSLVIYTGKKSSNSNQGAVSQSCDYSLAQD